MKIVIDIPETQWDWLHNGFLDEDDGRYAINAILKGTPFPKEYRQLFDKKDIINDMAESEERMLQVSDSLSESAYKEMCENGTDNVDYNIRQMNNSTIVNSNLCDSCVTKGCIFQSGIIRKYCDFYRGRDRYCT